VPNYLKAVKNVYQTCNNSQLLAKIIVCFKLHDDILNYAWSTWVKEVKKNAFPGGFSSA
jgi:hypothetical protein